MACNASVAIIVNLILSTKCLGEQFVWRYDLPAILLISSGCATIVLNANSDPVRYTEEEIIALLTSSRSICFFVFALVYFASMLMLIKCYMGRLRVFESDVDFFDEAKKRQDGTY